MVTPTSRTWIPRGEASISLRLMASRIAKPQMGGCGHALFLTLICWESLMEGQKNPGLVSLLLTGASRTELIPQRWIGSFGTGGEERRE